MQTRLLTIEEAAKYLHVSVATIRRCIRSGKLKAGKIGGQWRLESSELEKALAREMPPEISQPRGGSAVVIPDWAEPVLTTWRRKLDHYLGTERPDHVIANDRRGAKVWTLLQPSHHEWGKNVWHSTALGLMTPAQLKRTFARKRVLIFDEMVQHGREMLKMRNVLEAADAQVMSFVCICRKSYLQAGDLVDPRIVACEYLDDPMFQTRVTLMSQLTMLPQPPLDVDHLVIKGNLGSSVSDSNFLERLSNWGVAFVVRTPEKESHQRFLAITLDRPQFFNTETRSGESQFRFSWNAPCKIRFYINRETRECFCSFIAYPHMEGDSHFWGREFEENHDLIQRGASDITREAVRENAIARVYEKQSMQFALRMMQDFFDSGAAISCGIDVSERDAIDESHLCAAFGPELGREITGRVRTIITRRQLGPNLTRLETPVPPSLLLDGNHFLMDSRRDGPSCRKALLEFVPQKQGLAAQGWPQKQAVPYAKVFEKLAEFGQATLGRVIDYELDWGTIKPFISIETTHSTGSEVIAAYRALYRGELDPWLITDRGALHGHADAAMQRTLGIGPTVVDQFLRRVQKKGLMRTHFTKLFANLRHDWRAQNGALYYFLKPYKYGPIPMIQQMPACSKDVPFEKFLVEQKCLDEIQEKHGSRTWTSYRPSPDTQMPWRSLYDQNTDGALKAHIGGLVRLYAEIQKKCTTERPIEPGSSQMSVFHDPLVVLGAARNQLTTYACAKFEYDDWKQNGYALFASLRAIAQEERHHNVPFLKDAIREFAEPARLLSDKIEMYRHLPHLRKQIETLRDSGDFELAHFVLESVDATPKIDSVSEYPIENLVYAERVMRAFCSLTRQVLTSCGLDSDLRKAKAESQTGTTKDATAYLTVLLEIAPELRVFEQELREAIHHASTGTLNLNIANTLSSAFGAIGAMLQANGRLPSIDDSDATLKCQEFLILLSQLSMSMPSRYSVAVADIYSFMSILRFRIDGSQEVNAEETVLHDLRGEIEDHINSLIKTHPEIRYGGMSGDSIIFGGQNADELLSFCMALRKIHVKMLGNKGLLGPIRIGIALFDKSLGLEFKGVFPGVTAMKIGDKSRRPLEAIAVTKPIYDALSETNRGQFDLSKELPSGQGVVYINLAAVGQPN